MPSSREPSTPSIPSARPAPWPPCGRWTGSLRPCETTTGPPPRRRTPQAVRHVDPRNARSPSMWHGTAMSNALNPIDAVLWRAGRDRALGMTIGNLVILGGPVRLEDLLARLTAASLSSPRLRWRLDDSFWGRLHPRWVDNPKFDVLNHVRVLEVAAP